MNRMNRIAWVFALWVSVAGAATAGAGDGSLGVSVGVFNFNKTPTALEAGLELSRAPRAFGLAPVLGVAGTGDGSFWVYGGLRRDFSLTSTWWLSPGFGIALYAEGDGKDLGGLVEFRSSLELAVDVGQRSRIGVLIYHLSNAGFYDLNPGSNSAVLVWRRGR